MTRNQTLTLTFFGMVITYLLWNVDLFSPLAYPFRLFVTYVHEAGHGLAAIITGGQVVEFSVSPDGSGLALTRGGTRAIVIPAGYLGAAAFGAILFYTIHRFTSAVRGISMALGAFIVIFTILYARPDDGGAWTAIVIGLLVGGFLAVMGFRASTRTNVLVLSVLAIMTGLNAVLDVTSLIRFADSCMMTSVGQVCNDAQAFHTEVAPVLPASMWAMLWAALAVWMCGVSAYYSLVRPWVKDKQPKPVSSTEPKRSRSNGDALKGLKRDKDGDIDWSQF